MKLYDKVYVEREGMEEGIFFDCYSTVKVTPKEIIPGGSLRYGVKWFKQVESPSIVITLEELREVWDNGYVRGCEEYEKKYNDVDFNIGAKTFSDYLQSKGISNI